MEAKLALDKVIQKARVHFYKPIQIAEILYHYRLDSTSLNPDDLSSYSGLSKKWRDEISHRLVGNASTSSARYQDDVFSDTAMPPKLLKSLMQINEESDGGVEAYIYKKMAEKLGAVHDIGLYINSSTPESFSLEKLVSMFDSKAGLKRSMDKIFEIITYSLFSTMVHELKAQVTLEIVNPDQDVLKDFKIFIKTVLGIDESTPKVIAPASLYRVGSANAADAGLDMWANFGPAFQVKHLTLTPELAGGISSGLTADKLVLICKDAEKAPIHALLQQLGLEDRIQGIITFSDLKDWYDLCMSPKYKDRLGTKLLEDLLIQYNNEFPTSEKMEPFLNERQYTELALPRDW